MTHALCWNEKGQDLSLRRQLIKLERYKKRSGLCFLERKVGFDVPLIQFVKENKSCYNIIPYYSIVINAFNIYLLFWKTLTHIPFPSPLPLALQPRIDLWLFLWIFIYFLGLENTHTHPLPKPLTISTTASDWSRLFLWREVRRYSTTSGFTSMLLILKWSFHVKVRVY